MGIFYSDSASDRSVASYSDTSSSVLSLSYSTSDASNENTDLRT